MMRLHVRPPVRTLLGLFLSLLIISAWLVSGACVPGHPSWGTLGRAKFPQPPQYLAAQNVVEARSPGGHERVWTFETTDDPIQVHKFFHDALLSAHWEFQMTYPNGIAYGYGGFGCGPPFDLDVFAERKPNNQTQVRVRQRISSQFVWDD